MWPCEYTCVCPPHSPLWLTHLTPSFRSNGKKRATRKLFEKARVIDDPLYSNPSSPDSTSDRRVSVRYSLGSTFKARRSLLSPCYTPPPLSPPPLPSLFPTPQIPGDPALPLILVANETDLYRAMCCTHTTLSDRFLEIGSDLGFCTAAVHKTLSLNEPPLSPSDPPITPPPTLPILGVDISPESIDTSSTSYPHIPFSLIDALNPAAHPSLHALFATHLPGGPTVVAIDINGTRELPAVQECIRTVLSNWGAAPPCPARLIIVKSRALHAYIMPPPSPPPRPPSPSRARSPLTAPPRSAPSA